MRRKKIKIAHVVLDLNVGGLETLVVNMIKKVDREHFDSMVICLKTKGALADELIELGFDVHSMNKGEGLELDCFFKLAILLVKEKVDVVHLHNFGAYIYGGVAGILAGFKKMIPITEIINHFIS